MLLQHIIDIIESVVPLEWQEGFDNSGLQIGNRNAEIHAALLTTDVTEAVVDEAIDLNCDLIVSHHPLLFHGVKTISDETSQQRCVVKAIQNNIAVYSAHTSLDSYLYGVSGDAAKRLGLSDIRFLTTQDNTHGLGVVGQFAQPVSFEDLLKQVKTVFHAEGLRYVAPQKGMSALIGTVAFCGGAGAEFLPDAIEAGADVYISADFKYHEFQQADSRIAVIDMDHWTSEHFAACILQDILGNALKTCISQADRSPVRYI